MKTGMVVQSNWLYVSECCLLEVYFESGNFFSRCPRCSSLCDWEMVDVTAEDLKGFVATHKFSKQWADVADSKTLEPRHSY
jgi:hypothetical protein